MAKDNELPEGEDEQIVAPEETQEPQPEEQPAEQPEEEPDPVAGIAQEMGWVPKEKFKGKEDDWKPAAEYIREGKTIQKTMARDLKDMRHQMDTMAKTSSAILQERLNDERQRIAQQYQQAVEDGDPDKAWKASNRLQEINTQEQQAHNQGPAPEAQEWVQRNAWFNTHPIATAMAMKVADLHAQQGQPAYKQLEAAEHEVRRAYPELFGQARQDKAAPSVASPGSRSASPSNKSKGFSDMPRPAQDVARDMVDRGVIKSVDDYSRNYWASEGKAR